MGHRNPRIGQRTSVPVPLTSDLGFEEMDGGQSCSNGCANALIEMQQACIDWIVHRRAIRSKKRVSDRGGTPALAFEREKSHLVEGIDRPQSRSSSVAGVPASIPKGLGASLTPKPPGRRFERLERAGFVEVKERVEL